MRYGVACSRKDRELVGRKSDAGWLILKDTHRTMCSRGSRKSLDGLVKHEGSDPLRQDRRAIDVFDANTSAIWTLLARR